MKIKVITSIVLITVFFCGYSLYGEANLLNDPDPTVRSAEARRLGNENVQESVPDLIEALKDEVTGVRINAVVALGKLKDERAVDPLIDILNNDPRIGARIMAAEALANFDIPEVRNEILKVSDSEDENVRYSAVVSLGKIGEVKEIDKLIEKVHSDKHLPVREAAIKSLADIVENRRIGRNKRKEIKRTFKKARKDENKEIRKSAQSALKRLERVSRKDKRRKRWLFF